MPNPKPLPSLKSGVEGENINLICLLYCIDSGIKEQKFFSSLDFEGQYEERLLVTIVVC